MNQVLSEADVNPDEIDRVIFAGKTTRIPAIRNKVRLLTEKEPWVNADPDGCTACGAALQGGKLAGYDPNSLLNRLLVLEAEPYSISIETAGGTVSHLIEKIAQFLRKSAGNSPHRKTTRPQLIFVSIRANISLQRTMYFSEASVSPASLRPGAVLQELRLLLA